MTNSPLPDPDDPVEFTRGEDGQVFISLPSRAEAEQIVHRAYRKLAELPAPAKTTNPIGIIISYELFGLSDEDIAIATKLTIPQINQIRRHEAYSSMRKQITENVVNAGVTEVKSLFVEKQKKAADRVIELVDSPKGNIALKASAMVLGGAGVSLQASATAKDNVMEGIAIVIIEKDSKDNIPTIDLEAEHA